MIFDQLSHVWRKLPLGIFTTLNPNLALRCQPVKFDPIHNLKEDQFEQSQTLNF